jgi:WD repeat-containing protein 23
VLHTIMGHENDVNAVCFGDKDEPHLIYSGSDDGVLKVWDRRSLNDRREAGAFVGHKGGLTYIDSKNDGRYILSNGKDQTAKLWDVRMAYSTDRFREEDLTQYTRYSEYDYRYMDDIDMDYSAHPKDNSVVTFRGHKVQRTLIRCHFAPPGSANSRYVYSGSSDGKVHVWNMDSTVAKIIDVGKATKGTRRNDGRRRYFAFDEDEGDWEACVRDVSWHPHAPVMAASAWNSYNMSRGTTSVHAFTGAHGDEDDVPMGRSYDAMMQRQEGLYDMIYD